MKIKKNNKKYLDRFVSDFAGRLVVVTGANSGLGLEICRLLLYKGASIIMACRSLEKAEKAKNDLEKDFANSSIKVIEFDQTDPNSIKEFTDNLLNIVEKVTDFVFNAGVYHPRGKTKTKEGYTLTLGTNFYGAFSALNALENYILINNSKVHFISSLATKKCTFDEVLENLKNEKVSLFKQYEWSKFLCVCLAIYFKEKHSNITVSVSEPGVTSTNIIRDYNKIIRFLGTGFLKIFSHNPQKAALCTLRAINDNSGFCYVYPRGFLKICGYPKFKYILPKKFNQSSELIEKFTSK